MCHPHLATIVGLYQVSSEMFGFVHKRLAQQPKDQDAITSVDHVRYAPLAT